MRRSRASACQPVQWRSGVIASVRHRKRRVQSPVARISASAGLAPSVFATAPYSSQAKGSRLRPNSSGLASGCSSQPLTPAGRGRGLGCKGRTLPPRAASEDETSATARPRFSSS